MREILFRGKRTETGEWVEGFLWKKKYNDGTRIFMSCFPDKDDNEKVYVVWPETVGQYAGLTDKNGEKIFEGDIIAGAAYWLEHGKNGVVTYRDGAFGIVWYRGDVEQFNAFTSMCNVEYEVIGNIHNNPELLKGE